MQFEIISSTQAFSDLQKEWDLLCIEPLRSFDWHFTWWEQFGSNHELRIYAFRESGKLVGIAPFFVDRWVGQKRLRFLGSGHVCTDYAQIISADELKQKIVNEIIEDLQGTNAVSLVELEGIGNGESDQLICSTLREANYWRYDHLLEPTWILKIPNNWDEFKSQSSKSLRRKIKKAEKRLESGEISIRSTTVDLDFDTAFEVLVELHQQRFVSKGEPGVFSDSRFHSFLLNATRALVKKQAVEILIGYSKDESFAAQLYFNGSDGPQLYQAGVRTSAMKLEPGHLMFTYAVRRAIERGNSVFDFLRGSESYKPYWGAVPHPLTLARCVSSKLVPTMINRSYQLLQQLKQIVRPKAPAIN